MRGRMIRHLGAREWRSALASRWFWLYTAAIWLLGSGLLWMARGMIPGGVPADVAAGRVFMATVNLLALLVPLMGLAAGTQTLAAERDRRSLAYLMAQPVSRAEVLIGKLAGSGAALVIALGAAGVLLALTATVLGLPLPLYVLGSAVGLAWLLALASMALGAALAAAGVGMVAAQGTVLVTWLLLVLVSDLGLMGLLMARQLPAEVLLGLTFLNPVHQFRVAAVALIQPTLEALGPAGLYAHDRLGGALVPGLILSLIHWTAAAVLIALERFRHTRTLI